MIDITLPVTPNMVMYPGDAPPRIHRISSLDAGDSLTSSEIHLGCHTGTHVDAPAHFVLDGAMVHELALEHFYGPATVVHFPLREVISGEDIARCAALRPRRHILIRTDNGAADTYLDVEAAEALLRFEPLSIGFDHYSLDPPHATSFPAHVTIARRGIPVFVCLNLAAVTPGDYLFSALPLPIEGVEAIPVRAVLHDA